MVRKGTLAGIGAVVGAALVWRQWRQRRLALKDAQARGDRVEVLARLRTLAEQPENGSPANRE